MDPSGDTIAILVESTTLSSNTVGDLICMNALYLKAADGTGYHTTTNLEWCITDRQYYLNGTRLRPDHYNGQLVILKKSPTKDTFLPQLWDIQNYEHNEDHA